MQRKCRKREKKNLGMNERYLLKLFLRKLYLSRYLLLQFFNYAEYKKIF